MLHAEFKLKLGLDEFTLKAEVENEKAFFEILSFYSSLPKTGPNGETDLRLSFRTTTEGHKYYSIVSDKAGMEFQFGQNKENRGNGLFPKGWAPVYKKDGSEQDQSALPIGAVTQTAPVAQAPQAGPVQYQAPIQQAAPAPIQPQVIPQATTIPPTQVAQPVAAPVAAPAVATNPTVTAAASNVLARFGIKAVQPQQQG